MGQAEVQPELTDSTDMLKFMEDALREVCTTPRSVTCSKDPAVTLAMTLQLEQAQGDVDLQARAQLDRLRQQTAALADADKQAQRQALAPPKTVDELAIAGQLDRYATSHYALHQALPYAAQALS